MVHGGNNTPNMVEHPICPQFLSIMYMKWCRISAIHTEPCFSNVEFVLCQPKGIAKRTFHFDSAVYRSLRLKG